MKTNGRKSEVRSQRSEVRGLSSEVRGQRPVVRGPWAVAHGQRSARGIRRAAAAFTMIEIAICLAVIGFALVAIIGVLPFGMNVQKDNRQETIVNQDATVFMNAIRNGEKGLDELTNYVMAITNYMRPYNVNSNPAGPVRLWWYTRQNAIVPGFGITNGQRIVGLLSTPKIIMVSDARGRPAGFLSNHVVAFVRSISGPASEKFPQTNSAVEELALNYRLVADVMGYSAFDTNVPSINTTADNTNYWNRMRAVANNLHDVRLTFRWPLLANGDAGPSRQVFRATVSGLLTQTNEFGFVRQPESTLYLFEPEIYAKAP